MRLSRTFIIAEAGVNHNGSRVIAKKMIDVAVESGVDAVKFQTFHTQDLVTRFSPKAQYQKDNTSTKTSSQWSMLKKMELSSEALALLLNYCKKKKIIFLSSPFDLRSIDILCNLKLSLFKIPSGEITNLPYLRKIGSLKRKIILSTGASEIHEVKRALDVLIKAGTPKKNITLLHCNTDYPTPYEDVHLLAMNALKKMFQVKVGYSDHTLGIEVPVAAVALGAVVIEKHFTLDRKMKGPDHKASLEPHELRAMVNAIRNVEKSLGSPVKKVSPSESKNREIIRKSIVAARPIKKGKILTAENLTTKRPGTGLSPMVWDRIIGSLAKKNYRSDELVR